MEKIKLLLYCTKSKPNLLRIGKNPRFLLATDNVDAKEYHDDAKYLNGKIVAECDYEVEEIREAGDEFEYYCYTENLLESELLKKSCLTEGQLYGYLENGTGYAIHIKSLNIFDEARNLNYYHKEPYLICLLENAPQNMCYCYEYKGMKRNDDGKHEDIWEKKIIVSIRPEWLCLELNEIKDVEVRKQVLKEMLK